MVNPVPNRAGYFVLAYAEHEGEASRDLVAGGLVAKPGAEGDLVEGNIDFTENFQCHGEASTNGCQQLHAHAVERVRVRLMDAEGKVNVYWRRFHPMVTDAPGEAQPGKPFEQQAKHGVKLSVEVREVVEGAEPPADPTRISMVEVQRLQQLVQRGVASTTERMKLRNDLAKFEEVEVAAALEQVAAVVERLGALPDQARVQAAAEESRKQARAVHGGLAAAARAFTAKDTTAQDVQAFRAQVEQARQAMAGVFAPLAAIEQEMAELLALQDRMRAQGQRLTDLRDRMAAQQVELPTLDLAGLPIAELEARVGALLERSKHPQALAERAALERDLGALDGELGRLEREALGRVKAEQEQAHAFELKKQRVELWRQDPQRARQELHAFVEAAAMYPGLPQPHFHKKAAELGVALAQSLGAVADLRYHLPADQDRLRAELAKLAPVEGFLAEVQRVAQRIAAQVGSQRQQVELRGAAVDIPHAWVKVLAVHGDGTVTAQVRVHNEADRAARVDLLSAGQRLASLVLSGPGRLATAELRLPVGEISVALTGIGAEPGALPAGGQAQLLDVQVATQPFPLVGAVGATRHAAPYMFTAAVDQPQRASAAMVEEPVLAQYTTLELPGPRRKP